MSTGNTKRHSQGLGTLARLTGLLGNHPEALLYAYEAQRVASISADLFREAVALNIGAISLHTLGDYEKSMSLINQARHLLNLCGLSGGQLDHILMTTQAEVHKVKSEYVEARDIHSELLHEALQDQDLYHRALALLNIAEIDVALGAPGHDVQSNIDTAQKQFSTLGHVNQVMMCETILADLYLREGNILAAESFLQNCIRSTIAEHQITSYCLERLGDISRWKVPHHETSWTTLYFVHSLKLKEKLGIHKALQFLGDGFLACDDEQTAISLFTVALEGFTEMDIHQSRAECIVRLGDISNGHSDILTALELWEKARSLFERSSQTKQVQYIDERLARVEGEVLEQHKKNLARLLELNAPAGVGKELADNLSDIEGLEPDLNEAKGSCLISA
jgi:tetratricopeptide (TPR) repeat protein